MIEASPEQKIDSELIIAHKQGDTNAFNILLKRHLDPVFRFLARMVRNTTLAEDLAQETFLKAWKSLSSYDITRSFRPWIFTIARRTALDALRKKSDVPFSVLENDETNPSQEDQIIDKLPLPDALYDQALLGKTIEEALDQIPVTARDVILLHDVEDLTFEEISAISHEPMNTVKSRYRRAVHIVREFLTTHLH